MKYFKKSNKLGLFSLSDRLVRISKLGDPLERLCKIDWELFVPILERHTLQEDYSKGGRPPYKRILLFKMLFLQRYYNISDDEIERQVYDRLSFMRFLGLNISDDVPDAKTMWLFKDKLSKANVMEKIFEMFLEVLESENMIAHKGSLVDASFVEVPKQRNKRDDNKDIKEGKLPSGWDSEDTKNQNKLCQKDLDARWTKKGNQNYYGYKDHTKVDEKSKLITKYTVTEASTHDSQELLNLLDESDVGNKLYADSAYVGFEEELKSRGIINRIHSRRYKNKPLSPKELKQNRVKSKYRARVEHVFGFIENSMGGSFIRSIGKTRAIFNIGTMNFVYNVFRYLQLKQVKSV